MSGDVFVNHSRVDCFECMREAILGSHVDVTQLAPGALQGWLTHIAIGEFSLSAGSFSVGIRAQRTSNEKHLIIGILLGADSRVTHWSYDLRPADVLVIPPDVDHDGRFYGGAAYGAIRLPLDDVAAVFAGEPRLSDAATWQAKNHFRADPYVGPLAVQRLSKIVTYLCDPHTPLSQEAADYWRRSIIDAVTASIVHSLPPDESGPPPSAVKLVREVGHFLDMAGLRPIHVSEICARLGTSRRNLHRAFHDALGIGPVTFLRYKRMCNVHSVLRESDPAQVTVAEAATQHGFLELGRFSQYYHSLFGEYPSQTLRAPSRRGSAFQPVTRAQPSA